MQIPGDTLSTARIALVALRAEPDTELARESEGDTLARLTAAEGEAGAIIEVRLASDGLSLGAKLAIERGLKARLGPALVRVHFKRRNDPSALAGAGAASAQAPRPGPAPLAQRKSAFGLSIDRRAIPGVTEVLVVASGKGGVGKSTVSVNLAIALARSGSRVGLLDADVYGPSIPLMLGLSGQMPVAPSQKLLPLTAHGVKTVSFGFLTDTQQPVIWRGPLVAKAFKQLCYDVEWGDLDYLVIDLPPGTGDIQLTLVESLPVHAALIVTTPQDVALLDAHKALTMFEKLDVPVLGIVENMAQFVCPQCGHQEAIFGAHGGRQMAEQRRVPMLVEIPLALPVREGGDTGMPVALRDDALAAPFKELADRVRRGVGH